MMDEQSAIQKVQSYLGHVKRAVVKLGTGVLSHPITRFNHVVVRQLGDEIAMLIRSGVEVILVSSGAVGLGLHALGKKEYPKELSDRQAFAALGQGELMACYRDVFLPYGIHVAQVLLTRRDLENRASYLNARNTIQKLLKLRALPIINENDVTSTEELAFGDNDNLAALVAGEMDADVLVLLTTVDGLYKDWEQSSTKGTLVRVIDAADRDALRHAGGPDPNGTGLGGMASKVTAARMVASYGILAAIGNGRRQGVLSSILNGEGLCSYILPSGPRLKGRKHWIAYGKRASGVVIVDRGAQKALQKSGKSLLPFGIIGVAGSFQCGDLVEVHDESGQEFARGLTNFNAGELERLIGQSSSEISQLMGPNRPEEVIHRDNMVLL